MDTLKIITALEDMFEAAPKFLGFVKMDEDRYFQLVGKLRASLPEDMRRAGELANDTDRIREQAHDEAARRREEAKMEAETMLAAARSEAERLQETAQADARRAIDEAKGVSQSLTDQSEIARIATAQAREIIAQAESEAQAIRAGADGYANDVLLGLENQIQQTMGQVEMHASALLSTIQKGRQQLEKTIPAPGIVPAVALSRRAEPARDRELVIAGGRR